METLLPRPFPGDSTMENASNIEVNKGMTERNSIHILRRQITSLMFSYGFWCYMMLQVSIPGMQHMLCYVMLG